MCPTFARNRPFFLVLATHTTAPPPPPLVFPPAAAAAPPYTEQQAWDNTLRISIALGSTGLPRFERKRIAKAAFDLLLSGETYEAVTHYVQYRVDVYEEEMPLSPEYRQLPGHVPEAYHHLYRQVVEEILALPLAETTKEAQIVGAYSYLLKHADAGTTFSFVHKKTDAFMEKIRKLAFAKQAPILPDEHSIIRTAGTLTQAIDKAAEAGARAGKRERNDQMRDMPNDPAEMSEAAGSEPEAKRSHTNFAAAAAAPAAAHAAEAAHLPPHVAHAAAKEATVRGAHAGDNAAARGASKRKADEAAASAAAKAAREDVEAAARAKAKGKARAGEDVVEGQSEVKRGRKHHSSSAAPKSKSKSKGKSKSKSKPKKSASKPKKSKSASKAPAAPKKPRAKKGEGKKRAPKISAEKRLELCQARGVCRKEAQKAANKAAAAAKKAAYKHCKQAKGIPRMKCV